jgi:cell division protein ZapA
MTDRRNLVRVTIVGEEYSIRSDATPEHTRSVAEYVDKAITRVTNGGVILEPHKAAILAALQITDELFKARDAGADLEDRLRTLSSDVRRWLPPAKRGDTPVSAEAIE